MEVKILSCFHKKFKYPTNSIYFPIHVGKSNSNIDLEISGDDVGQNISDKNKNFCELTAVYWAWKNLSCDIVGLSHYRRYFDFRGKIYNLTNRNYCKQDLINEYLAYNDKLKIIQDLRQFDIILPKVRVLDKSIQDYYIKDHIKSDWYNMKSVIIQLYPEYKDTINKCFNSNKIYYYNMFIMNKQDFDLYCEWLFNILFELEKRINISEDKYQSRVFGFMSERLLNLYVMHNKFKIKEYPILYIDDEIESKSILLRWIKQSAMNLKNTFKFIASL